MIGEADNDIIEATLKVEIDFLIKKWYKKENIIQKRVNSVKLFNDWLNEAYDNKYEKIIWMFHWSPYSITLGSNEYIDMDTLKQVKVPSDFNIPIRLDSCYTWWDVSLWNDSIWEEFARQVWTEVTVPDNLVAPIVDRWILSVWNKVYNYREANNLNKWMPTWAIVGEGQWNTFNY